MSWGTKDASNHSLSRLSASSSHSSERGSLELESRTNSSEAKAPSSAKKDSRLARSMNSSSMSPRAGSLSPSKRINIRWSRRSRSVLAPENQQRSSILEPLSLPKLKRGALSQSLIDVKNRRAHLTAHIVEHHHVPHEYHPYSCFEIHVSAGCYKWVVFRRYTQFRELFKELQPKIPKYVEISPFPPKKFFSKLDDKTMEKRHNQLDSWLSDVVGITEIANSPIVLRFLDPTVKPPAMLLLSTSSKYGYLTKIGRNRIHQRRFFVLYKNSLYYYNTDKSSEPRGILDLNCASIEALINDEEGQTGLAFYIQTEERKCVLISQSDTEMQEWVIACREARMRADSSNENYLKYCEQAEDKKRSNSIKGKEEPKESLLVEFIKGADVNSHIRNSSRQTNFFPPIFREEDSKENIIYNKKGEILYCSPNKLLEKLCDHSFGDREFIHTFLLTYNCYYSPSDILSLLKRRYLLEGENKKQVEKSKERVLKVLRYWIQINFYDFVQDEHLTERLIQFLNTKLGKGRDEYIKLISEKVSPDPVNYEQYLENAPLPVLPTLFAKGTFDLFDLAPLEIARQITLIQVELFKSIGMNEFLNQRWSKEKERAPNLLASITQFNRWSNWISSYIIKGASKKHRGMLIERFILVAQSCLQLNNFEGMVCVIAGLECCAIFRLKASWEFVSEEASDSFHRMKDIFYLSPNFEGYRRQLRGTKRPAIPWIGLYLTDLTFLDEGTPEFVGSNNLINFEKWRATSNILKEIQKFQKSQFCIRAVPQIQEYLLHNLQVGVLDDDVIYKRSIELEPFRGRLKPELRRSNSVK